VSLATYDAYVAALSSPFLTLGFVETGATPIATANPWWSGWTSPPFTGAAPTTAGVPTRTTVGAPNPSEFFNSGAAQLRLARAEIATQGSTGNTAPRCGGILVCDRLSHQGGLSGIVTGEQTTNLPTAALTRYTTGQGVWAAMEWYVQGGGTLTTFTLRYTNQDGTGSRTTTPMQVGAAGYREIGALLVAPLQIGDTGVRSVEGVTLAASTGAAGAFGITLFKPLFYVPLIGGVTTVMDGILGGCGNLAAIVDDACLMPVFWNGSTTGVSTASVVGILSFIET
jgi:hypothetical protein